MIIDETQPALGFIEIADCVSGVLPDETEAKWYRHVECDVLGIVGTHRMARHLAQPYIVEILVLLQARFEELAQESAMFAGDAHDDGRHDDGDRLDCHHNSMMEAADLCRDIASGRKKLP